MKQKLFETFENRVAKFEKDEKLRRDTAALRAKYNASNTVKAADEQNPYLRARLQVLMKYPQWRRNEVLEMERTGHINNPHYDSFVHDVAVQGDRNSMEETKSPGK